MRRGTRVLLCAVLTVGLVACSDDSGGSDEAATEDTAAGSGEESGATTSTGPAADPYDGHQSDTYTDLAVWMCHPDLPDDRNVCLRDLDATSIAADGTTEVQEHTVTEDPAVDCFYIYPTISLDPSSNSDLVPAEDQEIRTVLNQVARMNEVCEVFAPVYRQRTLTALTGGEADPTTRDLAYDDVLDAWKQYISNHNDGRGVVLVGHSQGSGLLTRLIAEEIDDSEELRSRLVSAYLLGSSVAIPEGEVVGGDFQNVPLCTESTETGCAVSYMSFRSTSPPPADSFFGRTRDDNGVAACVDPVELLGRESSTSYWVLDDALPSETDADVTTPWVTYPGLLDVGCVSRDGFNYLEVTVNGDPDDPRADDIGGDLTPVWGLHLVDSNLTMGDQVELLRQQTDTYLGS